MIVTAHLLHTISTSLLPCTDLQATDEGGNGVFAAHYVAARASANHLLDKPAFSRYCKRMTDAQPSAQKAQRAVSYTFTTTTTTMGMTTEKNSRWGGVRLL